MGPTRRTGESNQACEMCSMSNDCLAEYSKTRLSAEWIRSEPPGHLLVAEVAEPADNSYLGQRRNDILDDGDSRCWVW